GLRGHLLAPETPGKAGPAVDRAPDQLEGVVVVPALQHLGQEACGASAAAGLQRVKEDEPRSRTRLRGRLRNRSHGHGPDMPICRVKKTTAARRSRAASRP